MSHLKSETTCRTCPLFSLPEGERQITDVKFSWGLSPREAALEATQNGASQDEVILGLGYEYRVPSSLAIAVAECAVRHVVSKNCSFS
jgi:hypothetical protein